MSTFCGRLRESDVISIDRFDENNLESRIFFLSHLHTDHMKGLDHPSFSLRLSSGCRLYTHPITRILLLHHSKFAHWQPSWVVGRDTSRPFFVRIPDDENDDVIVETVPSEMDSPVPSTSLPSSSLSSSSEYVKVSFMPSRHCLGSIMMLFEFSSGSTVLYTGDFRLTTNDLLTSPFNCLRRRGTNKVKEISSIYYDSTFCDREVEMVDREESRREVVRLAREWMEERRENRVMLWSYANYGHEFLLSSLADELGEKCHVTAEKQAVYSQLGPVAARLTNSITSDTAGTRIHACMYYNRVEEMADDDVTLEAEPPMSKKSRQSGPSICPSCDVTDPSVRVIKVSMMAFAISNNTNVSTVVHRNGWSYFNVQYSCHSSLAEVKSLLSYLRPLTAYPNVVVGKEEKYLRHVRKYLRRVRRGGMMREEEEEDVWRAEKSERACLIERLRQLQIEHDQ